MQKCDILVVGMGPVGVCMAALARQQGLSVIAIDREPDIYPLPRAAVFNDEIMRVFQSLGIVNRILPFTRVSGSYQFLTADGEVLIDIPPRSQTEIGWAEGYPQDQPNVERVLRARAAELGADMRVNTEFISQNQDEDGVTSTVEGPEGAYDIRSKFIIDCAGAWGPVRESVGIKLFDFDFNEPWMVVDAQIEPGALPSVGQQLCDPKRPTTHIHLTGNRFRWEFMLKEGETAEQVTQEDYIWKLLEPWNIKGKAEIERSAVYVFHGLVAEEWRKGRVLIAGDAAHQMPPFAGQGMCSGIRDALNLAWKLKAVIDGEAPMEFLDTYQQERDPHVQTIINIAIEMGKVVCVQDEMAAKMRNEAMLAARARGEEGPGLQFPPLVGGVFTETPMAGFQIPQPVIEGRHMDEILSDEVILLGRNLPDAGGIKTIDLAKDEASIFAPALDDFLASTNASAVLVRPDRHIFGTGDPVSLLSAWRAKLARLDARTRADAPINF